MNEFLNDNQPDNQEKNVEEITANTPNQTEEITTDDIDFKPVVFTEIKQEKDTKSSSKGLKVFSLILVVIIVLTATGLVGYFSGKNSLHTTDDTKSSTIELQNIPENKNEMSPAKIYSKVNPSVVGITVYNSNGKGSLASGIVYSKDGYIITNDHIYSGIANPKFKIHTFDGKEYDAKYVAGDIVSDLAVLKIEKCKLTPAVFGNSDELHEGQRVVAIGRPTDSTDTSSITSGIISAKNRRVSNSSNYPARLIQTDSPINPGSSGGALVNMYGQIVGVTNAKLASVNIEGVGYAIPTTVMQKIVSELISHGKVVSRAKLGVTYLAVDSVTAEIGQLKHTGLLIETVSNDSDLYGKIKKGDIITHINGTQISSDDMVLDIIEQCKAGDRITVSAVTQEGASLTLDVVLKANVGESSYDVEATLPENENNESSGGTFDFPFGE